MLIQQQRNVQMPPHKLFGEDAATLRGKPDKIFFVASHDSDEVTVQPMDPDEIARRMVFSLQEERMDFLSYFW